MSTLTVRRLGYALGAEITGIDASRPLAIDAIETMRRAWIDHIVVCLPGQNLDEEQLKAFAAQFGRLDDFRAESNRHPDHAGLMVVANKPVTVATGATAAQIKTLAGVWHIDGAHNEWSMSMSFLHAKQLPDVGGETVFANMYLAYETLSPAFQRMIEPLSAIHDYSTGEAYAAADAASKERMRRVKPPIEHPLVEVHPESGRKSLFFGGQVRNIVGMTEEETRPFMAYFHEHALRYEFTYRHRWSPGDIVMWDNRCVMHRAVADFDQSQLRRMLRCSLLGAKAKPAQPQEPALAAR